MFKPITIKDIANALNLSPSTVSRALSDSYEINPSTKKKVIAYAEEKNYRRNPMALSLKQRKSYSLGVVVCEVANSFFSQAIDGIESVAYKKGYNIVISQSHDSAEQEVLSLQHLANRSVDGILLSLAAGTTNFEHLRDLHDKGLPIVFFDRVYEGIPSHAVTSDNRLGARTGTEHLLKRGYRKIGHLANAVQLSITKERLAGYRDALSEWDIAFDESYVNYCSRGGNDQREVEEVVDKFLEMSDPPDAIFVASDRLSLGCLTALRRKRSLSEQPAVAGFSNSDVLDLFETKFSSVRQPAFEMGAKAADLLIELLESPYPTYDFKSISLQTELVDRLSINP